MLFWFFFDELDNLIFHRLIRFETGHTLRGNLDRRAAQGGRRQVSKFRRRPAVGAYKS